MKKLSANSLMPMSQIVVDAVETVYKEDLRDIQDSEKILAEYRQNSKSAVNFENYLNQHKHAR